MKYAVIQFINGSFSVKYEGENLDSLKYNYHDWLSLCGMTREQLTESFSWLTRTWTL